MTRVTAVLSMLHEAPELNSATRLFRQEPVLSWTIRRLIRSQHLGNVAVLCWEDQLGPVEAVAEEHHAYVLAKGPRTTLAEIESIAASRRWADGWRGGLLGACDFDQGFHGPWIQEISNRLASDAVLLADPSSALIDPQLVDGVIEHASQAGRDIVFTQAAPGLCGVLLRQEMLAKLAEGNAHPGRILSYIPDQPVRDPIASESCYVVPTPVARSLSNFKLDSDRQLMRITDATLCLNGTLASSSAEELVRRVDASTSDSDAPREVVLEITTRRQSRPVFSAARHLSIMRPDMSLEIAKRLFEEVACDDLRLTLDGIGDPLEHARLFEILELASAAGIRAIHVRTDMLTEDESQITRLAECAIDVVSLNLPATTPNTYAIVMGSDAMQRAMDNISLFAKTRFAAGRGVPILVPTFMKCRQNLSEMEQWYDQWLRAVGCAVITGPTDLAGLIPSSAVADMSPPKRNACSRLNSRLTVLSDGTIVACEEDVAGRMPMGKVGVDTVKDIWMNRFAELRNQHRCGEWTKLNTCRACKEWHRP